MMDWSKATTELSKDLSKAHVKKNPRGYDYVEGWHAIAEANRIFGFDGWTRETLDVKCIAEGPRKMGKEKDRDGFGVSYTARVRVIIGGVTRDGIGAGHGIDADLGLAHESAIKEAETDAMKRALMTFGNPFGLALYDKAKANVSDEPRPPSEHFVRLRDELPHINTMSGFATWMAEAEKVAGLLPRHEFDELLRMSKTRQTEIKKAA